MYTFTDDEEQIHNCNDKYFLIENNKLGGECSSAQRSSKGSYALSLAEHII